MKAGEEEEERNVELYRIMQIHCDAGQLTLRPPHNKWRNGPIERKTMYFVNTTSFKEGRLEIGEHRVQEEHEQEL